MNGSLVTRQFLLADHPCGPAGEIHFAMNEVPLSAPGHGEVLLKVLWLSVDPYIRGRISGRDTYARGTRVGDVVPAGAVAEVVVSNEATFRKGDYVFAHTGWQDWAVMPASQVRKIDSRLPSLSSALGVLGMPGFTAYIGLEKIGLPVAGETLVTAAAAGPVGSLVGQLAKLKGLRVVGIAGGADKCRYVVQHLGFDACIDHRSENVAAQLETASPKGIDIYFENVGGRLWDSVHPLLNTFARVPICGLIANHTEPPRIVPDGLPALMRDVLTKRLRVQGFINYDYEDSYPDFLQVVGTYVANGQVVHREDVTEGFENTPKAFLKMLRGGNLGKALVRVADSPQMIGGQGG